MHPLSPFPSQLPVVSLCSGGDGEFKSQSNFINVAQDIKREVKDVEKKAKMVADDCSDDRMKKVCLTLRRDLHRLQK